MGQADNLFSAGPALAGYTWQVGRALLELLRAPVAVKQVEIETADDLVLRRESGEVISTIQAKHSLETTSTISTASAALWKTIRVWSKDATLPKTKRATALVLLTTVTIDPTTPLAVLCEPKTATNAQLTELRHELDAIAAQASNTELKAAYKAWLKLSVAERKEVLRRAEIRDAQPRLASLTLELDAELGRLGIRPARTVAFREQLLGWFQSVVTQRLGAKGLVVTKQELNDRFADLVDRFLPLDLPDTAGGLEHPSIEAELAANPTYIQQLHLIQAQPPILEHAINTFLQATKQRDDWSKMGLVTAMRLAQFDRDLCSKWKLVFAYATGTTGTEVDTALGLRILQECMNYQGTGLGMQPYTHVTCGSFHMLANIPQLGWHPKYKDLIASSSPGGGKL